MNNQKKNYAAARWAALIIIVAFGTAAYLLFFPSGKDFLKKGAAIALDSWHGVFGGASGAGDVEEVDSVDENAAIDASSTHEFASGTSLDSIADNDAAAQPLKNTKSKSPAVKISAPKKSEPAPASPAPPAVVSQENNSENGVSVVGDIPVSNGQNDDEQNDVPLACPFPNSGVSVSKEFVLNEVAWMGSLPQNGGTAADAAKNEWIELKNNSGNSISLSGWQVGNASQKIKIIFDDNDGAIPAGGFLILARGTGTLAQFGSMNANVLRKIYSGDLVNAGDKIAIVDPQCGVSDFLDASSAWPAGNNTTKQTMERDATGGAWHTSVAPGGTPGAENSAPLPPPSSSLSSPSPAPSAPVPAPLAPQDYTLNVLISGSGRGIVSSSPSGIACGSSCQWNFSSGTAVVLSAAPDSASLFSGWSGACSGMGSQNQCLIAMSGPQSVSAVFGAANTAVSSTSTINSTTSTPIAATSSNSGGHLLIAAVQIAGASTTNDFVKIYNPTQTAADVSGWRLRKKSGTGTDSSLKVFPSGSVVAPAGYFTWANSSGGFSEAIDANVSSTESLAAGNSVALMDASSTIVDAVAWGSGTNQYVEGAPYPTDPVSGQTLQRISSGGGMVDTDNNANDFQLVQ